MFFGGPVFCAVKTNANIKPKKNTNKKRTKSKTTMVNVGDNVWVKCGLSGDYEELAVIQEATKKRVKVKYVVSGIYEDKVGRDRIRPMEDSSTASATTGRRSNRTSSAAPAYVTPTPSVMSGTSSNNKINNSANGGKARKEAATATRAASGKKRKKATAAETAGMKAKGKSESPFFSETAEKEVERKSPYFDECPAAAKLKEKSEPAGNEKKGGSKGRRLILASSDDDEELTAPAAKKHAAAKKPIAAKNRKTNSSPDDSTQSQQSAIIPDGNGGLNQPAPFIVEYSKTGRATCRTCDERISKGELRVGHTPLFRGKPGYMVFRHLHCTVFTEDVVCVEDVENYGDLTYDDYLLLANQVELSKEKIKEEMEELSPDELVQKEFQGEIRAEPPGLTASLLSFQIEGFSWMRHQEVEEPDIRGGILADEMGMGKTIQAIATILDHRPLLQHSKPGTKHPPTADLSARQKEDKLWEKAAIDWKHEMDILKVGKKLRPQDGGSRAGTLVVCPVIALTQWKEEIMKFTDGSLSICTYHGPDRESETPREMMKKYDIVLTTYQVMEADFRKMTSPNRVECPNCGGKFKIDKLPIHLKYFCGENAQRTEAQARQRRGHGRGGGSSGRSGNSGRSNNEKKTAKKQKSSSTKAKVANKKPTARKGSTKKTSITSMEAPRSSSGRSAARKAAAQISRSASDWTEQNADSDSDDFQLCSESSSDEEEDSDTVFDMKRSAKIKKTSSADYDSDSSSSSSDDSAFERARVKQQEAMERAKGRKKGKAGKMTTEKGKGKHMKGKDKLVKGKGKKKSFDDDSDDVYSSDSSNGDGLDGVDMQELMDKAMAGAKKSVLHSLCWWRIILDEAHMIKTRSSQTANAAFSLIGVHRCK